MKEGLVFTKNDGTKVYNITNDTTKTIKITRDGIEIIIEYEDGQSVAKIAYFEGTRLDSLLGRGITVPSETRIWDDGRGISVRKHDKHHVGHTIRDDNHSNNMSERNW